MRSQKKATLKQNKQSYFINFVLLVSKKKDKCEQILIVTMQYVK